jgi:anti-sigma B factor antagonist
MDDLSVAVAHSDSDHAVVAVAGEIDMATAPYLRDTVEDLVEEGCRRLVLDVARVTFCDSSGLAVLLLARKTLHKHGGTVRLVGPAAPLVRLFELSGVTTVFPMYDSVAEAITRS